MKILEENGEVVDKSSVPKPERIAKVDEDFNEAMRQQKERNEEIRRDFAEQQAEFAREEQLLE